jgi:hypothetical protein
MSNGFAANFAMKLLDEQRSKAKRSVSPIRLRLP